MATATPPRRKAANRRKPKNAARKASARRAARKSTAKATQPPKTSATQAKAAHAKGARTRAIHQTESALSQAETATRETAGVVGNYAERALLIPVGVALTARDKVVSGVSDTISTYSTHDQGSGPAAPLRASRRDGPQPPRARGAQSPRARRARTAPASSRDREDGRQSSKTTARSSPTTSRSCQPRAGARPQPRLGQPLPPPGSERPVAGKSVGLISRRQ